MSQKKPKPAITGPAPERVKIDLHFEEAVKKAVQKPRPAGGWPKEPSRYKKRQKPA